MSSLGSLLSLNSDSRVSVLSPWKANKIRILDCISQSFAGTSSTPPEAAIHWALGPKLATIGDAAREHMVRFFIDLGLCTKGRCSTTLACCNGNDVLGVAVVQKLTRSPPKSTFMDEMKIFGTVMWWIVAGRIPPGASSAGKRGKIIANVFHPLHKAACDVPHIYLVMLATNPAHQGKGHGGALLRALTRIGDEAGLPIYLEMGENNRSLYEHFGFDVVKTTMLDGGASHGEADDHGDESSLIAPWPPCPYLAMVRQPGSSLPRLE